MLEEYQASVNLGMLLINVEGDVTGQIIQIGTTGMTEIIDMRLCIKEKKAAASYHPCHLTAKKNYKPVHS